MNEFYLPLPFLATLFDEKESRVAKKLSPVAKSHIVTGPVLYYHYNCAGEGDDGWGCAYRCLQVILSYLAYAGFDKHVLINAIQLQDQYAQKYTQPQTTLEQCSKQISEFKKFAPEFDENQYLSIVNTLPSIYNIQRALAAINNIPPSDIGSHRWIEPPNAAAYLQHFCTSKFLKNGSFKGFQCKEFVFYNPQKHKYWISEEGLQDASNLHPQDAPRIHNNEISVVENFIHLSFLLRKHFSSANAAPVMFDDAIRAFTLCGYREIPASCLVTGESNDRNSEPIIQVLRFDPHEENNVPLKEYQKLVQDKQTVNNTSTGIGVQWMNLQVAFKNERYMLLLPSSVENHE